MATNFLRIVSVILLSLTGFSCSSKNKVSFVKSNGENLTLNGKKFFFSGGNSYSMLYSKEDADKQFATAKSLGLNVIRLWGFWNMEFDKADIDKGKILQPEPMKFSENGWKKLDYVIYLAGKNNIKLIIPLLNNWSEFGGTETYMRWAGIDIPELPESFYKRGEVLKKIRPKFWKSKKAQKLYLNYVKYILNRKNSYTGVLYKNEPSIMIWEVMNEPRYGPWSNTKAGSESVRDWISTAADYIKSIDSNHLVATGEEGFLDNSDTKIKSSVYPFNGATGEGSSFVLNSAIKSIDVLGFHMWPFQWSLWGTSDQDFGKDMVGEYPDLSKFAEDWVKEHKRIASKLKKPIYLGEFGFQILRREGSDISDRNKIIESAYQQAIKNKLSGLAFWNLTSSNDSEGIKYKGEIIRKTLNQSLYNDTAIPHDLDFKFDIICPKDKSTCDIIKKYSKEIIKK
ncbi:MAG: cellulase family glycosylhydrolase [Deltaproteobacteria bacterium]|nr:cellulase family glycosylhydrolase [Deltaproteobacteria bacterium]